MCPFRELSLTQLRVFALQEFRQFSWDKNGWDNSYSKRKKCMRDLLMLWIFWVRYKCPFQRIWQDRIWRRRRCWSTHRYYKLSRLKKKEKKTLRSNYLDWKNKRKPKIILDVVYSIFFWTFARMSCACVC